MRVDLTRPELEKIAEVMWDAVEGQIDAGDENTAALYEEIAEKCSRVLHQRGRRFR